MAAVTRLVTFADLDDDAAWVSVSASHEAELTDGRRLVLLADRGWSAAQEWATTSVADIERTTRTVVGPDEPFDDRTNVDMETDHWKRLKETLQRHGIVIDATKLARLPHDVVPSERLLARLDGSHHAS